MDEKLKAAVARVALWAAADNIEISVLAGGITNQNYRVQVGADSFVLRIGGANTDLLSIDRNHEYTASKAAAKIGIAPEVIDFIEPEGYLITRFIDGHPLPPAAMRERQNLERICSCLRQIHALPEIDATFSPFRTVETYAETASSYGVAFPANFDWLLAQMRAIEAAFVQDPFTPRLCHNDLLNENFLDDGQIRVLDWEYAGMGDPFFDLANFAVHHDLTDEHEHVLLACYFGHVTPARSARLKLMKLMSDFREAMWGTLQIGVSQLDFDFRGYADKHFERMTRNMADPRVGQWLLEVTQGV